MTYEELFDAYREVVSQRDRLIVAGDQLWSELGWFVGGVDAADEAIAQWKDARGIGSEPPVDEWSEC